MRLVDSHCHLETKDYAELPPVLERARAAGLVHAIVVGQFQGPGAAAQALVMPVQVEGPSPVAADHLVDAVGE